MQGSASVISSLKLENASRIGVFSKTVTLRICRILYRLRSSPSCIISKYAAILTFPLFADLDRSGIVDHHPPESAPRSKNRFVNHLSTLRLAGRHCTHGVKTLRLKAERLASIRNCRECCPVMSKDVHGSARPCKAVEGGGSHF